MPSSLSLIISMPVVQKAPMSSVHAGVLHPCQASRCWALSEYPVVPVVQPAAFLLTLSFRTYSTSAESHCPPLRTLFHSPVSSLETGAEVAPDIIERAQKGGYKVICA